MCVQILTICKAKTDFIQAVILTYFSTAYVLLSLVLILEAHWLLRKYTETLVKKVA
jgi:hypothetical protein